MSARATRALIAALLIAAATLFAIGVAIERHHARAERARAAAPTVLLLADADRGNQGDVFQSRPDANHRGAETRAERSHGTSGERRHETPVERRHESAAQVAREHGAERIFGINPDSIALVVVAVVVSLALAAAIWLVAGAWPLLAVVLFTLGAAVFDGREIAHQVSESRTNLVVIASVVTVLHLAAAVAAGLLAVSGRRRAAPARPLPESGT